MNFKYRFKKFLKKYLTKFVKHIFIIFQKKDLDNKLGGLLAETQHPKSWPTLIGLLIFWSTGNKLGRLRIRVL